MHIKPTKPIHQEFSLIGFLDFSNLVIDKQLSEIIREIII